MNYKLIRTAVRISKERLVGHPEFLHKGSTHFSFLILKNKIISVGLNHRGENPIYYGYPNYGHIHSEIDAFRKARGLLRGDNFKIINVRLGRSGNLLNSKPCKYCQRLLYEFGCSEVIYSTENSFIKL